MQKTITQIVEETVEYYTGENQKMRGLSDTGSCLYWTRCSGEDVMCAVGRCMIDARAVMEDEDICTGGVVVVNNHHTPGLDSLLKEEYRGHSVDFWEDLQEWHDSNANFIGMKDDVIMTRWGRDKIKAILSKHAK